MSEAAIALRHDELGRLVLTLPDGQTFVGVAPVRCFPFTAPDGPVSFCDEHGKEVHHVRELGALGAEVRAAVEGELALREFIPEIERIHSVSPGAEPTEWHVQTDRGERRFTLESEDDIRRLGPHGALIADEHGVRFRIRDTRKLDKHSRKILERYL